MPTQRALFVLQKIDVTQINHQTGNGWEETPRLQGEPFSLVWRDESPIKAGFSNPWFEEAVLPKRLRGGLEPHQRGGWLRPRV